MRNIFVERLEGLPIEEQPIEIVERKGIGHPDYICDLLAEAASQTLSKYYLKKFGTILHYNLDKGLLVAGRSQPKFGGGKILEPIKIIIAGRATDRINTTSLPIAEIVKRAAKKELARILNLTKKELEKNFQILVDYKPGAANLQEVFKRGNKVAISNDTSFGVGHAPLSKTEKLTLNVANLINSQKFIEKFPFVGRDIKVMVLREKKNISVIFTIPYIDRYIKSVKEYFERKEKIKKEIEKYIKKNFDFKSVRINHNTLDNPQAKSENEIYLTCTGLSAEQGDDGQVGRGNRVCGLITPCREMSLEAAAGKNINHPGKLYQALSFLIAQKIGKIKGVQECYLKLLSEIGKPLDQPQMALIKLRAENFEKTKEKAIFLTQKIFDNLKPFQISITKGKYRLF